MIKKLVKHGNSYALIIDKPILDLLNITPDTELEVGTDGSGLQVTPVKQRNGAGKTAVSDADFDAILDRYETKYSSMFTNLAKGVDE